MPIFLFGTRRAEGALAARPRLRPPTRRVRAHRAGRRLGRGRRRARRPTLRDGSWVVNGVEDVHHERRHRADLGRDDHRAHRRGRDLEPRRRERDARLRDLGAAAQARLEGVRHARADVRGLRGARRRTCSGRAGKGFHQFLEILDGGRISVAAMGVGLAQGAYDLAFAYAKERTAVRTSRSRRSRPSPFKLADMAVEIEAGRQLVYRAAWLKDQGRPFALEAAMAKLYTGELSHRVVNHALQIHGGYGFMDEFPISRLYRDQKILEIGEGTNEVQRLVIAPPARALAAGRRGAADSTGCPRRDRPRACREWPPAASRSSSLVRSSRVARRRRTGAGRREAHVTLAPPFVEAGAPDDGSRSRRRTSAPGDATTSLELVAPPGVELAPARRPAGWTLDSRDGVRPAGRAAGSRARPRRLVPARRHRADARRQRRPSAPRSATTTARSCAGRRRSPSSRASAADAPQQHLGRAVVAGAVGLAVIAASLARAPAPAAATTSRAIAEPAASVGRRAVLAGAERRPRLRVVPRRLRGGRGGDRRRSAPRDRDGARRGRAARRPTSSARSRRTRTPTTSPGTADSRSSTGSR